MAKIQATIILNIYRFFLNNKNFKTLYMYKQKGITDNTNSQTFMLKN